MSYNPITDFLALLRQSSEGAELARAPLFDVLLAALARGGLLRLSVGQTAPTANQASTAWLKPAQPSWSAEGTLWLWDAGTSTYVRATPALFSRFLQASASGDGFMYVGTQLMQWGTALVNNNAYTSVLFPIRFSSIPRVQVTPKGAPGLVASGIGVPTVVTDGFVAAVGGATPLNIDWLATGPA